MILAVFAVYMMSLAAIGIYCSRYSKSIDQFVLGGRRLGPWVTAFSAQASDFSGWLLIGLPGAAYLGGFSMVWTCIGCTGGVLFNWLAVAPVLRVQSERYHAITIPDYLEARFADRTRIIRLLAMLTILLFYSSYIGAQFTAAGRIFQTAFGASALPWGETASFTYYHQGLVVGAVIIVLYTAIGGFMAVCWTDFLQAILMVTTAVALPIVGVVHLGGIEVLWERMTAGVLGDAMLAIDGGQVGNSLMFGVVLAGLSWFLGYPGQPHIVSRFMAIEDPRKIPQSTLISMVWTILALYGSMFIGFVALAVVGPELTSADKDMAMPRLAVAVLPSVLAGLVLSAGVAAIMSTVDSQLIVAVSAVVHDGYQKLLGGHPSHATGVWLSRATVLGLGVYAAVIAWRTGGVYEAVLDAWGGLAAGLGPAIVLGCVWKRTSRSGIIAGMLVGVLLTQFWSPITGALAKLGPSIEAAVSHLSSIELVVCVSANLVVVVFFTLWSSSAVRSVSPHR